MAREFKEKTKASQDTEDEVLDAPEPSGGSAEALSKEAEKLTDEIDDLLDEVDTVLEPNAQEFVSGFVQKGGQ